MRFCILLVVPDGWQHAGMYTELAETLVYGFRRAGHDADVSINVPEPHATNILLNAQMLPEAAANAMPPGTVVYNLEHVEDDTFDWAPSLRVFLKRFEVWDYSAINVARIRTFNPRVFWLPIGTEPELTRIPKAKPQDIDVLFYGFVNDRRRHVIDAIAARGLNVQAPFGVYGKVRDDLIARSKVVLNVHQVAGRVLEIVRVSYLLANRKAVVTEVSADMQHDKELAGSVHAVAYERIVEACETLVKDAARRRALELAGYRLMSARRQSRFIKDLLKARGG